MKRVCITGGCGFIGSHFVDYVFKNTDWDIVVLDRLSYASDGYDKLRELGLLGDKRVSVFSADFTNPIIEGLAKEIGNINYIVHMGAESHVANSIIDPKKFAVNNIIGTLEMLEFAKRQKDFEKFIYFSTDEIFGPATEGIGFKEEDGHNPGNPYSASKAGAEDICVAYANTYKLPIMITRTTNIFGERQHLEKFIPMTIRKVLKGETILIHSNPAGTKSTSRFYLYIQNLNSATLFLLKNVNEFLEVHDSKKGKFNITAEREVSNLEVARFIALIVNKWQGENHKKITPFLYEMVDSNSERPGCDFRYVMRDTKLKNLGWSMPVDFENSLENTIRWFLDNPKWLKQA